MRAAAGVVWAAGVVALLLAASCSDPAPTDPLEEIIIGVPGAGTYLMSVPLKPDRNLTVSGVDLTTSEGLDGEYLGFVTQCGDFCEVSRIDEDARNSIADAVEGRVPFQAMAGVEGPYLVFAVTVTRDGARTLRSGDCLVVRNVLLTQDSGEKISVRRPGYQFLWVLSREEERSCLQDAPQR